MKACWGLVLVAAVAGCCHPPTYHREFVSFSSKPEIDLSQLKAADAQVGKESVTWFSGDRNQTIKLNRPVKIIIVPAEPAVP